MAVITRYVDTDVVGGLGDGTSWANAYSSLSAWNTAEATDLVTATDTHIVNCRGVAADTSQVLMTGWTTNASYYVTINGDNTSNTYNTSAYRLELTTTVNYYYNLQLGADYTVVNNIQLFSTNASYTNNRIIYITGDYVDLRACIVKAAVSTSMTSTGIFVNAGDGGSAYNCLVFDVDKTGSFGFNIQLSGSTADFDVRSCTCYNCDYGFRNNYQDSTQLNNLAQSCVQGFDTVASNYASVDYCVSDVSGEAVGVNGSIATVTFVDAANDDYTPASGDTAAKDSGFDDSATFTTDLAGATRPTGANTWDVGALEYVASASISAVDSPVLDAETSNTLTVSGFGSAVNDVDIRAVEDTNHNVDVSFSGTDPNLTFDMPDVSAFTVDTLGTPFDSTYWSHEIVVTDGTDSPTATIVVNPQANWARVDLAETPDVGTGSVLENFTGFYDDITAVSVANPSQLTLADTSDWVDGQEVTLSGFTTTPDINGTQTITIVNSTTVSIPVNVTAVTDGVGKMYTGAASEHGQLYYPTSDSTAITSAGILTTDKTSNFTVLYFDTVDSKWKPFTVLLGGSAVANRTMLTSVGKMMR